MESVCSVCNSSNGGIRSARSEWKNWNAGQKKWRARPLLGVRAGTPIYAKATALRAQFEARECNSCACSAQ